MADAEDAVAKIDVSVIIKTFNEEAHIARAIESAFASLSVLKAEVIIADSHSTDQTINVAKVYPVKLVKLLAENQRSCGIGHQLGYQYAQGEFIYLMDGDMELIPGFLEDAISRMNAYPELAGVAGEMRELGGTNYEFEVRKTKESPVKKPGIQRWLVGGGLYRKAAIDSVGYLTNRNLHANEEKELGLRLTYAGWKMERIPVPAIQHYGYSMDSLQLMRARWNSRYVDGPGELLRSSLGKPYFWEVLKSQKNLLVITVGWVLFATAVFLSPWSLFPMKIIMLMIICAVILFMFSKGGVVRGVIGLINHQVYTAGYLRGILRRQVDPGANIDSVTY